MSRAISIYTVSSAEQLWPHSKLWVQRPLALEVKEDLSRIVFGNACPVHDLAVKTVMARTTIQYNRPNARVEVGRSGRQ